MSDLSTYADSYEHVRIERTDGILQITLHHQGGPAVWSGASNDIHAELGDLFYKVGRDPENRVVIITGTGDSFMAEMDVKNGGETIDPAFWDRIYKEGKDLLQNLLDIEVPVIGAVNGPALIHAEVVTMSDIVIASEQACFADKAHAVRDVVPGDGVHVWWPMVLGVNRARHFLLTGAEIGAEEAREIGFVAEVVPAEDLLARAWEIAYELVTKSPLTLRYTRVALTQHIKRRMLDDVGYGLVLEGMGIMARRDESYGTSSRRS